MRDGLEALAKMTTLARLKGAERVVAVATSAVREAANGADFLARVKAQTGLDVQLLTGVEEGRLIYRAVREVVDLGTGTARPRDRGRRRRQHGVDRHPGRRGRAGGEPHPRLAALRRRASRATRRAPRPSTACAGASRSASARRSRSGPVERLVATSGTAVCCADLIDHFAGRALQGGRPACSREVRAKDLAQLDRAAARPLKRRQIADLPPVGGPRSESLLAGAVLLQELVAHAGVDRFQVCDRALREGLVLAALGQPIPAGREPARPAPPPGAPARRAGRERLPAQPADRPPGRRACSTSRPPSTAWGPASASGWSTPPCSTTSATPSTTAATTSTPTT